MHSSARDTSDIEPCIILPSLCPPRKSIAEENDVTVILELQNSLLTHCCCIDVSAGKFVLSEAVFSVTRFPGCSYRLFATKAEEAYFAVSLTSKRFNLYHNITIYFSTKFMLFHISQTRDFAKRNSHPRCAWGYGYLGCPQFR